MKRFLIIIALLQLALPAGLSQSRPCLRIMPIEELTRNAAFIARVKVVRAEDVNRRGPLGNREHSQSCDFPRSPQRIETHRKPLALALSAAAHRRATYRSAAPPESCIQFRNNFPSPTSRGLGRGGASLYTGRPTCSKR